MILLLKFTAWLQLFLFFIALLKMMQVGFILLTDFREGTRFKPTFTDKITIWLSLAYLFTEIVFIAMR